MKWIYGLLAVGVISLGVNGAHREADLFEIATAIEPAIAQATTQSTNKLTEESINKILAEIDAAGAKEDIEAILKYVAPFTHSDMSVDLGDSTLTIGVDGKDEHRNLLRETYGRMKQRNIVSEQKDIQIAPNGDLAIATIHTVTEFVTEDGKKFISGSTDILRFALINNQPMIVSATLKGWFSERPSSASSP